MVYPNPGTPLTFQIHLSPRLPHVVPSFDATIKRTSWRAPKFMSVMGACAYLGAAKLTVYAAPQLILLTYNVVSGLSAPETDLIQRCARAIAARLFYVSYRARCSFPPLN